MLGGLFGDTIGRELADIATVHLKGDDLVMAPIVLVDGQKIHHQLVLAHQQSRVATPPYQSVLNSLGPSLFLCVDEVIIPDENRYVNSLCGDFPDEERSKPHDI
jgi:hypothetical protein